MNPDVTKRQVSKPNNKSDDKTVNAAGKQSKINLIIYSCPNA